MPESLPSLPPDVGLTWRALTVDDVPAWFHLKKTIEDHDDAVERTAEHELTTLFTGSWRDPERDFIGGFDEHGRMRAWARTEFRPADEGTPAPILLGGVHPADRGRGIGRALLAWSEARARQQLVAAGSTGPARLRVFVDEHQATTRSLVERAGYSALRWYVEMRRDLSQPLPKVGVDDVRIELYDRARDEDVRLTHNESFAVDHWGSNPLSSEEWTLSVVDAESFRADWSFVAVDPPSDRVVGYLISGRYEQDWEPQGYTEGWTDLLAVRREYRGRGIAEALLTAAMHAYADAGLEYAGLDVDTENPTGALGLYERLGYVRERSTVMYAKELA
ncbi:GNAT family N-acetyltransferase [Phytoactinopolyspora halophila]|uniref:GNAT family N-acetyltransferase n=1 Tax=Phytoactinopolyspora halophila TaxID=1981511 RepID=UPI001B8B8500|nr:GNAT family N-acetyltransferase [Phytoactinopolyspora halophila]